ncbi:mastermind-like protein 3 [Carassius carassius]|uniref:mastermind-like protein 3 n=1 Tax=Carassius carassius TaxID=217509 RepID=UPI002868473A|nr:mastermind-like protein 3 [Carassius carassius]
MMGDFASPAAVPTGGGICINNSNVNLNSAINATNSNTGGNLGIPKHSTVVERLRQRIEGCRRHHVNCESRYHQAHAEQLELDRRETLSLYQRSLEQRAKKSSNSKQQSKQQEPDSTASTEQRSSTLIALQETVKRKLDSARSPLNGDQNGLSDGSYSPTTKRLRKEGCTGMDTIGSLPPISPLHPMDIKPNLPLGNNSASSNNGTGNGNAGTNHITGRPEDLGKNGGMPDIKLNGSLELEDGFSLLKDMKQEPLDDGGGIDSSETSLSNQNKLFSDINLNDQEWQELIDELANTVPEDDMHDLFNEDFEEKKEVSDFTRATTEQTQLAQDPAPNSVTTAPNSMPQSGQMPMGSPQVRPSSSGPPFATAANGTPPQQPLQQSPAVGMPSGSPANCVARSPQTPTQAQTQTSRPGNGYMMNAGPAVGPMASTPVTGGGPGSGGTGGGVPAPPTSELSPAEQLKQMAAQQQQRAKLIQQKHQQQSQAANWSPAAAPTSPYSGPFNPDKPNSPMMYTQTFNASNTMGPKTPSINNYLPQNHMNMLNQQQQQQQSNNLAAQNNLNKQLSYSNTKPLTHFSGVDHMSQRITPPMANQPKNPMMPYLQGTAGQGGGPPQAPGPMPNQSAHLSEEQKRMMMMNKKMLSQGMPYGSIQQHVQEGVVGLPRQAGGVQPPHGGPGGVTSAGPNGAGPGGYMPNPQQQQQAAMMKQMMAMEQEKRVQLHLMEQQKVQLMREQRQQQQQQHMLAEQLQQQQHLPRQMSQAQRNPYPLQQFQGTSQEMAARNQALQNMRNARLLQQQQQQNPGILQMTPVQNSGAMPSQGDMSIAYGGQAGTQTGIYQGMKPNMGQMLQQQQQHHPNQPGMVMAQRQGGAGGQGMVGGGAGGGYGQGMLMNPSLPQQQIKSASVAPGGQPMANVQRLQSMMGGGGQTWPQQQQQNMQAMGGRTSNDIVAFNSNPAYAMQGGQAPRMAKQHFAQAMGGQTMVDPRSINPAAMGGPMMPHMAGQPRTNQPRGMVMPGMNQGVPNMAAFGQGPAQGMPGTLGGGGPYLPGGQPPGYQRTSSQDLAYGYSSQSGAGPGVSFGLSDGTDLDSTEGWMDEFFPSQ